MQNVIVLGGSYAGSRAAHLLSQGLGNNYRVIMIDRNTHANHLYVIPRMSVLPGHEHKPFIPYIGVFNPVSFNDVRPPSSPATAPPPLSSSSSASSSTSSSESESSETVDTPPTSASSEGSAACGLRLPDSIPSRHVLLHAHVTRLTPSHVYLDRTFPELHEEVGAEHVSSTESSQDKKCAIRIPYRYAVYALGSKLPAPIDLWGDEPALVLEKGDKAQLDLDEDKQGGETEIKIVSNTIDEQPGILEDAVPNPHLDLVASEDEAKVEEQITKAKSGYGGTKLEAMEWLRKCQARVKAAESVLCVGGGALGIQFATDIKSLYPEKQVTLLHSRHRLLPRFDYDLHSEVLKALEDLRVDLILGERLDLESTKPEKVKLNEHGQRVVRTVKGREVAADLLLLCTGQTPNTDLLREMAPESVFEDTKLAFVLPTMQLGVIASESEIDQKPVQVDETDYGKQITGKNKDEVEVSEETGRSESESESFAPCEKDEDDAEDVDSERAVSSETSSFCEASTSNFENSENSEYYEEEEEEEEAGEEDEGESEPLPATPYPHVFVVGDAADAFGAIKAGHTAYWQAEVAARNVIRLARAADAEAVAATTDADTADGNSGTNTTKKVSEGEEADEGEGGKEEGEEEEAPKELELESYTPGAPAIKVSLGVRQKSAYQINGVVGRKEQVDADDLDAGAAWGFFGVRDANDRELYL